MRYENASPYSTTRINRFYLDTASLPSIAYDGTEIEITIEPKYHCRPDLLAYEAYGSSRLWWIFRALNPNVLRDPVFDFKSGTRIKLLSKDRANTYL